MRSVLSLFLLAAAARGAVIRGVVTEALTGSPLARTLVQIEPIAGTPGGSHSVRAGERGAFEFSGLAPGGWILRASRPGYLPLENGQRRWNSAGLPLVLTGDDAPFVALRLQRTAAVEGTVRDPNEIGIAGFDVAAWRAGQPAEVVARGKSDDRGVYRLQGLTPGVYFVRSGAHVEDELQFIPTFASSTVPMENARPVEVFADEEVHGFDVRPLQGKLFRLSGMVTGLPPEVTDVTVTLASETGREKKKGLNFQFAALAPGEYELYAEAHDDPPGGRLFGAYTRFTLTKNMDGFGLGANETLPTSFQFVPGNPGGKAPGQLYARRKDLAGVGETAPVTIANGKAVLAAGRWELLFVPNPGNYVESFSGMGYGRNLRRRAEGWNEVPIQYFGSVRYGLSGGGGAVAGVVKQGGEPVAGAPVYLEAYDAVGRVRLLEPRSVRSGLHGEFRFDTVPPGTYRICATFEYGNPDAAAFELMGASQVQVDAHQSVARDLDLFGGR